jgi:hypothetical protein
MIDPLTRLTAIEEIRDAMIAWLREAFHGKATVHHGRCHEITIDGEGRAHGVIAVTDYIRKADRKTPLLVASRSLPRSLSRRRRRMAHLADEANAAI